MLHAGVFPRRSWIWLRARCALARRGLYIRVDENEGVKTEHEATVSKIGEEQLFY